MYRVADKLCILGVPYLFATGGVKLADAYVYRHRPRLEKPFTEAELVRSLAKFVKPPRQAP